MKITVIIPTGEVRKAIGDEYGWNEYGKFWDYFTCGSAESRLIGKAHEIEVPDWACFLRMSCDNGKPMRGLGLSEGLPSIPLPCKPLKVKKWQWVLKNIMSTRTQPTYFVSLKHYATSQDAVEDHFNVHAVLRINETEIEVEE